MAFKPGAPCHIRMSPNTSGGRRSSDIRYVVIHSTDGPQDAAGIAAYFDQEGTGSTQLVVDNSSCWRCVPDLRIPWGATGGNQHGLHIEQCGLSWWSRWHWLLKLNTIKRAAWHSAKWCRDYNLPPVWLSPADLRNGKKGLTSHNNISAAFDPGGHTDPGPKYPYDKYLYWTKRYRANM